jgi:hypothetical protein
MSVTVIIEYKDGSVKFLEKVVKDKVDVIVEHHSQSFYGEIKSIKVEDENKREMDLDGYYAYMETLKK